MVFLLSARAYKCYAQGRQLLTDDIKTCLTFLCLLPLYQASFLNYFFCFTLYIEERKLPESTPKTPL